MYDSTKVTDNYGDYGGNDWYVEGTLHITETGKLDWAGNDFGPAENISDNATVGELITALKLAGIIKPDPVVEPEPEENDGNDGE